MWTSQVTVKMAVPNKHEALTFTNSNSKSENLTQYKRRSFGLTSSCCLLPPFTQLGENVAKIFKPLGVSLGESLEARLSPCS